VAGNRRAEKIHVAPRQLTVPGAVGGDSATAPSAARLDAGARATDLSVQIAIGGGGAEIRPPPSSSRTRAAIWVMRSMARRRPPLRPQARPPPNRAQPRDVTGKGRDGDAALGRSISQRDGTCLHRLPTRAAFETAVGGIATSARAAFIAEARAASYSPVTSPRIGVKIDLPSSVCSTVPTGVRMIRALDSGIECASDTSQYQRARLEADPSLTDGDGMSGAPGSLAHLA